MPGAGAAVRGFLRDFWRVANTLSRGERLLCVAALTVGMLSGLCPFGELGGTVHFIGW
jgi:hypothetical protein